MDLDAVITQLKAFCPLLGGRVAGAAEFMSAEFRPEGLPAAYVVPLALNAGPNDEMNALFQVITERIGVIVEFSNVADRRGQGVTRLYAPTQKALFAALLNWRGLDMQHAPRGLECGGGDMIEADRARIFYQWEFTLESQLTEADGWIVNAPLLRQILANSDPGDPLPTFAANFP